MKLHSPGFLRTLRRGVKRTVRRSPELKREFRKAGSVRRNHNVAWIGRAAFAIVLGVAVHSIALITHHVLTALAVINLWCFIWIFVHAQNLLACLFQSTDLRALLLLPVDDSIIFRWELQKFFRKTIMLLLDLVAGYAALGIYLGFPGAKFLAVLPMAIISWAVVLGLAALCAARLPRFPYQMVILTAFVFGFVIFIFRRSIGDVLLNALDAGAPELNVFLPTGWPALLFRFLLPGADWVFLGLLAPIGLIVWSIKNSLGVLRGKYVFMERTAPEPRDIVPEQNVEAAPPQERPQQLGTTAIEDIVQSRLFLSLTDWDKRGWPEKILWRRLTDREKKLAEFVFPAGVAVSYPWKSIARNFAIAGLIACVAGFVSPTARAWALGLGFFVTLSQMLSQFFGTGKAFQSLWSSSVLMPLYSGFGIGFRELARLYAKYSAVQFPFVLMYAVTCGVLISYFFDAPVLNGLVLGVKGGCLLFACRFITLVFSFSSGTNDTTRFRLGTIVLLAVVAVFCVSFLILGAASLFAPNPMAAWILLATAVFDAYVFLWVYGWFYHRGTFDLMKVPQR